MSSNRNKNSNNKPEAKKEPAKKVEKVEGKKYRIKEENAVGFKARNYFIRTKNYLLSACEVVDEETFNQFNYKDQKIFFEDLFLF